MSVTKHMLQPARLSPKCWGAPPPTKPKLSGKGWHACTRRCLHMSPSHGVPSAGWWRIKSRTPWSGIHFQSKSSPHPAHSRHDAMNNALNIALNNALNNKLPKLCPHHITTTTVACEIIPPLDAARHRHMARQQPLPRRVCCAPGCRPCAAVAVCAAYRCCLA